MQAHQRVVCTSTQLQLLGDSAQRAGNKCTNCITFDCACTHVAAMSRKVCTTISCVLAVCVLILLQKGGTPQNPGASIIEDVQAHLNQILDTTTVYTVPKDTRIVQRLITELARYARLLEHRLADAERDLQLARLSQSAPPRPVRPDDEVHLMEGPISRLTISDGESPQFGGTTDAKFMLLANRVKEEINPMHCTRRPEFWSFETCQEHPKVERPPLRFPPPDLLDSLVNIFLTRLHPHFSYLHGPTLLRQVAARLHHTSHAFGSVVLAVCAIGSQYCSDPRVGEGHHVGWEWYKQLQPVGPTEIRSPETALWDLQLFPLMCNYAYSSKMQRQCPMLTSMGLRMCQTMHLHRSKRRSDGVWTPSDEMLRRAWWALVASDAYASSIGAGTRNMTPDQ